MTGLAWLLKNDPRGWRESQPKETPMNPRRFQEYVGGVGVRKEFGVHRQYVEREVDHDV